MRTKIQFRLLNIVAALAAGLLLPAESRAAVVTSTTDFTSPPAVISGDLLETSATLTSQTGNFVHEGSDGPSALSDGIFPAFVGGSRAGVTTPDTGNSLVYTFDTATYPLGYQITSIITSGGWADDGRDRQNYVINYTTVDDPTLQLLANVSYEPGTNYSAVTLTDDTGALITGLATLQILFPNQENTYAGYGEFDIVGSAIIPVAPEPNSLVLLGLGALGLTRLRRHRASAALANFS